MLFFLILVFCCSSCLCSKQEYVYENQTKFPPDRKFTNYQLMELRDLVFYPAAWTEVPEGLFEIVPDVYNTFLSLPSKHILNTVIQGLKERIGDANKLKEAEAVLIRYSYCLGRQDIYRNCPRPCNNMPCAKYDLGNSVCRNRMFQEKKLDSHTTRFTQLASIFRYRHECTCPSGYKWHEDENKIGNCVQYSKKCKNINICNFGTCYPFENEQGYVCKCHAAFKGLECDIIHDPCEDAKEHQCGNFTCTREPSNAIHGYRCECGINYEPVSKKDPACIDRDECKHNPCLNGGTCINTYGSYTCMCPEGFTGQDCYMNLTALLTMAKWSDWTVWSECSRTCNDDIVGYRVRYRTCPMENACGDDSDRQVSDCEQLPLCREQNSLVLSNVHLLMFGKNKTATTRKAIVFTNFHINDALSLRDRYAKIYKQVGNRASTSAVNKQITQFLTLIYYFELFK